MADCCTPSYRTPTFNLSCNIWRQANPRTNPPNDVKPCNFSAGQMVGIAPPNLLNSAVPIGGMWLRLPWGTIINDGASALGMDVVEVPGGSGRFYTCNWTDWSGAGFANQHVFVYIQKLIPFPGGGGSPVPPPPPPPPPGPSPFTHVFTSPAFLGLPVATYANAITNPSIGSLHIRVAALGTTIMAPLACNIGGGFQGPQIATTTFQTIGLTTCYLSSFLFNTVAAGPLTVTVRDSFSTPLKFAVQVYHLPNPTPALFLAAVNNGLAPPVNYAAGAGVGPNLNLLTSNLLWKSMPLTTYPTPWALLGTDGTINDALFNWLLTTAVVTMPVSWTPNYIMTGGSNSGWNQNITGYF